MLLPTRHHDQRRGVVDAGRLMRFPGRGGRGKSTVPQNGEQDVERTGVTEVNHVLPHFLVKAHR